MQLILKFQASAPPVGANFHSLWVTVTDDGGTRQPIQITAEQIQATAEPQGGGVYHLPLDLDLSVGPYHITAQQMEDSTGTLKPFGPVASVDGEVPIGQGAWCAVPVAFV